MSSKGNLFIARYKYPDLIIARDKCDNSKSQWWSAFSGCWSVSTYIYNYIYLTLTHTHTHTYIGGGVRDINNYEILS